MSPVLLDRLRVSEGDLGDLSCDLVDTNSPGTSVWFWTVVPEVPNPWLQSRSPSGPSSPLALAFMGPSATILEEHNRD